MKLEDYIPNWSITKGLVPQAGEGASSLFIFQLGMSFCSVHVPHHHSQPQQLSSRVPYHQIFLCWTVSYFPSPEGKTSTDIAHSQSPGPLGPVSIEARDELASAAPRRPWFHHNPSYDPFHTCPVANGFQWLSVGCFCAP